MKGTKLVQALRIVWEKAPHPSPLPEGEGTDWGILKAFYTLTVLR